jgi:uncharacterized protein (TIGR03086 family)
MYDLGPSAQHLARLVRGVRDDQLAAPTPCPAYAVADLLDHVQTLAAGFALAARRGTTGSGGPPAPHGARLRDGWRDDIPALLDDLAAAWAEPGVFDGEAEIAGFRAPAPVICSVAAHELVVHGWDLARATGQVPGADTSGLEAARPFADQLGPAGSPLRSGGGFGDPVPVAQDASVLDRLVADSGRDPGWVAALAG